MNPHPHVHVVQTTSGLSLDGHTWVTTSVGSADTAALAEQFRQRYVEGLIKLYRQQQLIFSPALSWIGSEADLQRWLAPVLAKRWCIDCQAPPPEYGTKDGALKCLSRYVVGAAINDGRVLGDDGQRVTIRIKDYRHRCEQVISMSGEEFVRRFAFHILPRGLHRMRYAGLFQPLGRKERLATCRAALADRPVPRMTSTCHLAEQREALTPDAESAAHRELFQEPAAVPATEERPPRHCPRCAMPGMKCIAHLTALQTQTFLLRLEHLLQCMITIVTTLEHQRWRRASTGSLPALADAPITWTCIVISHAPPHACSAFHTLLPLPDT